MFGKINLFHIKTTDTHKIQSQSVESELAPIFKAQAMRVMTLCANFSLLKKKQSELPKNIAIKDIPQASFGVFLTNQIIDTGRANASINNLGYGISFFQDPYHREVNFNGRTYFSLAEQSCVIQSQDPGVKLIPVSLCLPKTVILYLIASTKFKKPNSYTLLPHDYTFKHYGQTETLRLIQVPNELVNETLHTLGMLGALPNRDWQLKFLMEQYDSLKNLRDYYLKITSSVHKEEFPANFRGEDECVDTQLSFSTQKKSLLKYIDTLKKGFIPGIQQEQRLFYIQFLIHLIQSISIDETSDDLQYLIQSALSLQRIETILQNSDKISYSSFLRVIEACLDEILVLLTLNENQVPATAFQTAKLGKQFIKETVGIRPQRVTFRSSGMQAIWSSLQMGIDELSNDFEKPVSIFITDNIYFEVVNILRTLFNLHLYRPEQPLSIELGANYIGTNIPFDTDVIYDIYFANFESNILVSRNQIEFTDINIFVENQFRLRKETYLYDKRLIVIIDNTMSDFDEIYLPVFLMQFDNEIKTGKLCVLVCHSGNKYLHLGTDKQLAALLYGFYNPTYFTTIDAAIMEELKNNRLGDFESNSPTVLLTKAFLTHGKEEILKFSTLIRQRTLNILKTVPKALKQNAGYFTIDDSITNATYKDLSPSCNVLRNCAGFIIVKSNFHNLFVGDINETIYNDLNTLLLSVGIKDREGFAFSQTTRVRIRIPGFPDVIRISIGTESLDHIIAAMQLMCDYFLKINLIMGKVAKCYNSNITINSNNPQFTPIFDDIKAAFNSSIVKLETSKEDDNFETHLTNGNTL